MAKEKGCSLVFNQFKVSLKYEYVQRGVELMQMPKIQNDEDAEQALGAFAEIPGYREIPPEFAESLQQTPRTLRIVLIADHLKSAQMCAVRLCAMHRFGNEQADSDDLLACLSFDLLKKHVCGTYPDTWIEDSPQIIFGEKTVAAGLDDEWVDMLSSINHEERDVFVEPMPEQQNQRLIHRLEFEWSYEVFTLQRTTILIRAHCCGMHWFLN